MSESGALEKIVGKKNVLYDPAILREYSSDSSFVPPHEAAVRCETFNGRAGAGSC